MADFTISGLDALDKALGKLENSAEVQEKLLDRFMYRDRATVYR